VRACVRVYAYARRSPMEPSIPGCEPESGTPLLSLKYCTYGQLARHLAIVF